MTVTIYSFGLKVVASRPIFFEDDTFDCRGLRNPWNRPALAPLNGTHFPVKAFVEMSPGYREFMALAINKLADGKTFAFFCFGGQHRSVVCAEALARECQSRRLPYMLDHRVLGIKQEG
jgi:RNase adaptor protein for sRNA GlmZ degradation